MAQPADTVLCSIGHTAQYSIIEPMDARLSTTSYAILGQLMLRSWTTYELAREVRNNFRFFWPRGERGIYAEAKRLTLLGLLHGNRSSLGKRPRTTYVITEAGRSAFAAWMGTAPQGLALEFEGLLRVFFGALGTPEQLFAALDAVESEANNLVGIGRRIGQAYLVGSAPFQGHVYPRALVFEFLWGYARLVQDWTDHARAEVQAAAALPAAERDARARAIIERALAGSKVHTTLE